jgi:hypothetical protein
MIRTGEAYRAGWLQRFDFSGPLNFVKRVAGLSYRVADGLMICS